MPDRATGTFTRDPRLDRAISWGLASLAAVALSVGAYFFKALNDNVADLTRSVGELRTELAVARVERGYLNKLGDELGALEARVGALERGR